MTIEVAIPDELLPSLDQRSRKAGLERGEYVLSVLSRDLSGPRPFDEILSGFREEVAASGMSDEELDQLFEAARQDSLQDR